MAGLVAKFNSHAHWENQTNIMTFWVIWNSNLHETKGNFNGHKEYLLYLERMREREF